MIYLAYIYDDIEYVGVINNDKSKVIPINEILSDLNIGSVRNMLDYIKISPTISREYLSRKVDLLGSQGIPLDSIKILPPIAYPIRDLICLGLNYKDHAIEICKDNSLGVELPKYPIYFSKAANPAIGHMDTISNHKNITKMLDYEVELAVIIGKGGTNISARQAEEYIFGYTIANDITARDLQTNHQQWYRGKSLDTFCSIGPYIVDKDVVSLPSSLEISCKVNGEVRQKSNIDKLIFDIPYIISDISRGFTLNAGDIILTGTPAGVGMGYNPPLFLKSGDIIECNIEKIGSLVNIVE